MDRELDGGKIFCEVEGHRTCLEEAITVDEGMFRRGDVDEGVSISAVVLGENGSVIIGSGMVRRLRCIAVSIVEGPLFEDIGLLMVFGVTFPRAEGCNPDFKVSGIEL